MALMALPAVAADPAPPATWPTSVREAKVFMTTMPNASWARMMQASLSLRFFVGQPIVAVINPFDEEIVSIMCDCKWALVGAGAKVSGAPSSIPARTVGFVPTKGFDNYCKQSITAVSDTGEQHKVTLSILGDFTNSTSMTIQ